MESSSLGGEQFGRGGSARNPIERKRLDEPLGPVGKNRVHLRAETRQVPGELNGLISGDAPGDAEDDPPSLPRAPGMKYLALPAPASDEAELDLTRSERLE